jgi:hypothetical protein
VPLGVPFLVNLPGGVEGIEIGLEVASERLTYLESAEFMIT